MWMIARLGISLTVGALATTLIIRSLSVEDYGVYSVLYCLIGYASVIGGFGIPSVFQRFIPEALQKKQYSLLKKLIFRGLILRILLSGVVVAVVYLIHGPLGRLLKIEGFLDYFWIFSWGIIFSLEATLLTSVLHSLFLHKYSVIASTIYTVFRGVCVVGLLQLGCGIRGLLWAEVVAWVLWTFLLGLFYYIKFLRLHAKAPEVPLPLRRYTRYGAYSAFSKLGESALGVSTDFFVITAFLGPGAVAFYAFAHRVIRLFLGCMPHVVLINVIKPSFFTKYAETGSKQDLVVMFNLLVKLAAFCVFPLAAGIFVLGGKMIAIVFKPEYLGALPILWILTVSIVIGIFASPTGLVLLAVEKVQIGFYSKIFAIYNLAAELLVIQMYGVIGVVLVTCSAGVMKSLFIYYYARKYVGLRVDWRGLSIVAVNATLMAGLLLILRPLAMGFLSLAVVAMVGGAGYLACSWANKAFNPQERGWVNGVAPRPMFVF